LTFEIYTVVEVPKVLLGLFGNNVAKVVTSENGIRQSPIPMAKMVDERTDWGRREVAYSYNFLLQSFLK
jgi:hypothetical protein